MRTARHQKRRRRLAPRPPPGVPPMPYTPFSTAWMAAEADRWADTPAEREYRWETEECPCCVARQHELDFDRDYRTRYPDAFASDRCRYDDRCDWQDDYYDHESWYDDWSSDTDYTFDGDEDDPLDRAFRRQEEAWAAAEAAERAERDRLRAPVPPVRQLARSGAVAGKVRLDPQKGIDHRRLAKRARARGQRRAARWVVVEGLAVG